MKIINYLKTFEIWSNSGLDYIIALSILVVALIAFKIFRGIILASLVNWVKQTKMSFDDTIITMISDIKFLTYFWLAFYMAVSFLNLPSVVSRIVGGLFTVFIVFEVIRIAEKMFDYIFKKYLSRSDSKVDERQTNAMSGVLRFMVRLVLWSFGSILVLSNLGVDITSLIAGLGIGGLAVALALQNVLSDLFSALSIYIDRPFQVGDFIAIGSDKGSVERIGLKTTRIRSITGEELVISNRELTDARVQNFGRLNRRRASFTLGVVYGIKSEKLKQIPGIIKGIVEKIDKTDFDRCHFKSFGNSSLNFETVFWVDSDDYTVFMNILEQVNLEIYERFAGESIEFAYPTQTLYIEK